MRGVYIYMGLTVILRVDSQEQGRSEEICLEGER